MSSDKTSPQPDQRRVAHPVIAGALERPTTLLLAANEANREIQPLPRPGNLTASPVAHAARLEADGRVLDCELLTRWDAVAISKWLLACRADARSRGNWVCGQEEAGGS